MGDWRDGGMEDDEDSEEHDDDEETQGDGGLGD